MKITLFSIMAFSLLMVPGFDEQEALNQNLTERIKVNKQYLQENLELYDDSPMRADWVKMEKESSAAMLDLLEHAKNSKDLKLKKLVLKNEYYMEIMFAMDSIEFGETDEEIAEAKTAIEKYKKAVAELTAKPD